MKNSDYNIRFDILRILGIFLIIFYHFFGMWPFQIKYINQFLGFTSYAVDLFFALSGWLIGIQFWKTLHENRFTSNKDVLLFGLKRVARIYPLYLLFHFLSWLPVFWIRGESFDWSYLFLLQNYRWRIPYFQMSWFLCVMLQFYMVLPLVLFYLSRSHRLIKWGCYLFITILPLLLRCLFIDTIVKSPVMGFWGCASFLRYESLWAGMMLSYFFVHHTNSLVRLRHYFLFSSVFILSFCFYLWYLRDLSTHLFLLTLLSIGNVLLIMSQAKPSVARDSILTRVVKFLSSISFAIYLCHALIIHVMRYAVSIKIISSAWLYCVVYVSAVLLTAWIVHVGVERPSSRLIQKKFA